ncbi:hypothetical protein [Microbacterium murale]|uniref:ATP synthase protein I n=1 Tax=Microbacterium murale TaxID=1081040 RepID=A0ABQ1RIU2_9MICO|nr:hypothetical protein [Microbacterium murale]GGD71277.1 hypothetical protein GCM10007269_13010 [Microbacterium murale]
MSDTPKRPTPAITSMLRQVLIWTGIAAIVLVILGGGIGFLVAGTDGLWSGLAGVALAIVFLALTPLSVLIANRWYGREMFATVFFAIVMGSWLLKLVVFVVAIVILRGQDWVVPLIIFLALVAGIVVSLVIDAVVFTRMRMPYASEVSLPETNPEDREDS